MFISLKIMICTLCSENMVFTGTMRPNIGSYECGHSFHLNCILSYSANKITQTCPTCNPQKNVFFANFGENFELFRLRNESKPVKN